MVERYRWVRIQFAESRVNECNSLGLAEVAQGLGGHYVFLTAVAIRSAPSIH